jgi:hypothetical protein
MSVLLPRVRERCLFSQRHSLFFVLGAMPGRV